MAPCTQANPLECPHTCGSMKVSIPIDVSYESTVKGTTKLPLTVSSQGVIYEFCQVSYKGPQQDSEG